MCLVPLPETYYEEGEEPYCQSHFYEESAHKCGKCEDYITGPTMVSNSHSPSFVDLIFFSEVFLFGMSFSIHEFLNVLHEFNVNCWKVLFCCLQTVGISQMFHPECFVCDLCGEPVGEKDPYTLFHSGRLLW